MGINALTVVETSPKSQIHVKITWSQNISNPNTWDKSTVKKMTTGQFPDWEGTFLLGLQAKFVLILNLLVIATQTHPVFTRKHMTAQISHEYHNKNREKM